LKKLTIMLLASILASAGLTPQTALSQEKKAPAAAKELRWHGIIIRINKDESTLDVRKANVERKIHFDSSTKWTQGTKTVDMSEFKEGSDVICLGSADEKGEFRATRIDLRRQS
jgi:hypothetical protein